MERYSGDGIINVGTGEDVSIAEFAALVADVVGYDGSLKFNTARPDGAPLVQSYADFLEGVRREA